jgi:hypothetical protein
MLMEDKVKITKLPPGEAIGARDLRTWASRRAAGRAGVPTTKTERAVLDQQKWQAYRAGIRKTQTDEQHSSRLAERWLAKHDHGRGRETPEARKQRLRDERIEREQREAGAKRNRKILRAHGVRP